MTMVNFIYFYLSREKKQELETYADKLNHILSELKKERANQGWFLGGFICTDTSLLACVAHSSNSLPSKDGLLF